jgi:hypothetical protein
VSETPCSVAAVSEAPCSVAAVSETPRSVAAVSETPCSVAAVSEALCSVAAVSEAPCSPIKQFMITSLNVIIHKPQLTSADKITICLSLCKNRQCWNIDISIYFVKDQILIC